MRVVGCFKGFSGVPQKLYKVFMWVSMVSIRIVDLGFTAGFGFRGLQLSRVPICKIFMASHLGHVSAYRLGV